jgi:hypothetical protein
MPLAPPAEDRSAIENAYRNAAANRLRENPRDLDALEAVGDRESADACRRRGANRQS